MFTRHRGVRYRINEFPKTRPRLQNHSDDDDNNNISDNVYISDESFWRGVKCLKKRVDDHRREKNITLDDNNYYSRCRGRLYA